MKLTKDCPFLNSFDLKRQIECDPLYEPIANFLAVIRYEDLVQPNIPCLLPKELASMRLAKNNMHSNYMTTALCSIALQEELVYICLGTDAISDNGNYSVFVNEMGERCELIVSDSLIVLKEGKLFSPYYCNTKASDVWAYILEKAIAMKYGLYSLVLDGKPHEVIYSFLDGDYKVYSLDDDQPESILSFIKTQFKNEDQKKEEVINEYVDLNLLENKKIIIVCRENTIPTASGSYKERTYYKIIDYKSIKVKDQRFRYVKLLLIDNSYKDLSDLCFRLWSEVEMASLDRTQFGSNHCWILYDDIIKYFTRLSVNSFKLLNLKPEYNKSMLKMCLDGEHSCVLVHFESTNADDKFVIGVHQKHKKFFQNIKKDYQYANLRIVLIRLEEKTSTKDDLLHGEAQEVLRRLKSKKLYIGKFESSSICKLNDLADVFLKPRLKKGKYLLAIEVFWKVDYFKNINLSISTSLNAKVDTRLIGSGSNFDIVFYKTFVSYYIDIFESEINGQDSSKSMKSRDLAITNQIQKDLAKRESSIIANRSLRSSFTLNYIELMEGFYVICCKYIADEIRIRIHLTLNPQFMEKMYILSPELMNLLDSKLLSFDSISVDIVNPMLFFLVRKDLNFPDLKTLHLENFFSGFELRSVSGPTLESTDGQVYEISETTRSQALKDSICNLYFEHLFFESMLEINVPYIKKTDKELLQMLAKQYLRDHPSCTPLKQLAVQYQYGLDNNESGEILNDSNQTTSFVEMNQETLSNLLRRFGKVTSRPWSGKETQAKEYIIHSDNFLAILIENKESDMTYVEFRDFTVTHLAIDDGKHEEDHGLNSSRSSEANKIPVEFRLEPKQTKLIVLNLTEGETTYKYSYSVKYKFEQIS